MICRLCQGHQNLIVIQPRIREWYTCPACHGLGVRFCKPQPDISISASQQKVLAKAAKQMELDRRANGIRKDL